MFSIFRFKQPVRLDNDPKTINTRVGLGRESLLIVERISINSGENKSLISGTKPDLKDKKTYV